jgi:hypothetical protein
MKPKRILAVLVVVIVWMACGSETPVAPVEEEGSAGVTLAETQAVAGEQLATTESTGDIEACYTPGRGTIYRIRAEGVGDVCRGGNDVEFSWNAVGPQGPPGADGQDGAPGGLSGWEVVQGTPAVVPAGQAGSGVAYCSPGKKIISGGAYWGNQRIYGSSPHNWWTSPQGWYVSTFNPGPSDKSIVVWAICANAN